MLDSFHEEQSEIKLNLRGLELTSSELIERNGNIHERVQGAYFPTQLRFAGVSELEGGEFLRGR